MKPLSKDKKILFYFFLFLLIIWLIFDSLKYSWADDTFQKVILAPLGEEPFKILFALMLCAYAFLFLQIVIKSKKEAKLEIKFINSFHYTFIPCAIISAIILGLIEGAEINIILHFSVTTIAAIFIIIIFQKVKYKDWKNSWKVFLMLFAMLLPMLLHSISNQYANITYANNHPEFEYLVTIAKFFETNTFLINQGRYVLLLFGIAYLTLNIFIYKYFVSPWILRKKSNKKHRSD